MDFYVGSVLACQHLSQGCCTLFLYTVTGDISKVVHVFLCKPQWVKRLQKTHLTSKRQKLSCTKLRPRCAHFLLDKKLPPFFFPPGLPSADPRRAFTALQLLFCSLYNSCEWGSFWKLYPAPYTWQLGCDWLDRGERDEQCALHMRHVLFSLLDHKNSVIRSLTSLFAPVTQPPPLPTFLHAAAKWSVFFAVYMPGFSTWKAEIERGLSKKTAFSFQKNLLAGSRHDRISDLVGPNDGWWNTWI